MHNALAEERRRYLAELAELQHSVRRQSGELDIELRERAARASHAHQMAEMFLAAWADIPEELKASMTEAVVQRVRRDLYGAESLADVLVRVVHVYTGIRSLYNSLTHSDHYADAKFPEFLEALQSTTGGVN